MKPIGLYIASEDEVTKRITEKLLSKYCRDYYVINNFPYRGGGLKKLIPSLNNLAADRVVVLLMDLDTEDCPPSLKAKMFNGLTKEDNLFFNIAVDEAEAWLMADAQNFAAYFGLDVKDIPQSALIKQGGPRTVKEIDCKMKSSFYLTHELAPNSSKREIRESVAVNPFLTACKGENYNAPIIQFIENFWDPETARQNSDSLNRMIERIKTI